jgi:hypothetical protein
MGLSRHSDGSTRLPRFECPQSTYTCMRARAHSPPCLAALCSARSRWQAHPHACVHARAPDPEREAFHLSQPTGKAASDVVLLLLRLFLHTGWRVSSAMRASREDLYVRVWTVRGHGTWRALDVH